MMAVMALLQSDPDLVLASVELEVNPQLRASVDAEIGDAYRIHVSLLNALKSDTGAASTTPSASHTKVDLGGQTGQLINFFEDDALNNLKSCHLQMLDIDVRCSTCGVEQVIDRYVSHPLIDDLGGLATGNQVFRDNLVAQQFDAIRISDLTEDVWMLERAEWTMPDEFKSDSQGIERSLFELREKIAVLSGLQSASALAALRGIAGCTGHVGKAPPVAVRLGTNASTKQMLVAGACLQSFALRCLTLDVNFSGSASAVQAAESIKQEVLETGRVFAVLSAWLRALGALTPSALCDLCYRHRATRKRCREHKCSGTQTPEAREASWILPWYQKRYQDLSASEGIFRLTAPSILIGSESTLPLKPDTPVGHAANALYAALDRFSEYFHTELAHKAKILSGQMVSAVEVVSRVDGSTTEEFDGEFYRKRRDAPSFLSLATFLGLLFGKGVPVRWSHFGVAGMGIDEDHPLVKAGALNLLEILDGFVRHRAWSEAAAEYRNEVKHRLLNPESIAAARLRIEDSSCRESNAEKTSASYRQLGLELGYSHTAVRKVDQAAANKPIRKRKRRL